MDETFPNELLAEWGKVSLNFVELERNILFTISLSLSTDSYLIGSILGTDNFEALLSKLKNSIIYFLKLHNIGNNDLLVELKGIIKKLREVQRQRNEKVHALIFKDEHGKYMLSKIKRDVSENRELFDFKPITLSDLIKLNKDINDCFCSVSNFRDKIDKLLSS